MGIKIVFTINREIFRIEIKSKEIFYNDRRWSRQIRLIPEDKDFLNKIKMSRNKIPAHLSTLFKLTKEEQAQYNSAKTDEELADICIVDARKKGAQLLKKEVID